MRGLIFGMVALATCGMARADEHDGIQFGVAKVVVATSSAYICQGRYAKEALTVANDPTARDRMGDLNYAQTLIQNGCFQVERGATLKIYALSEHKSPNGIVVSPRGKVGRMGDFADWFGGPLWKSTLHTACHTEETAASRSTTCGLEY